MTRRFETHVRRGFGVQATIAAGAAALMLAGGAPAFAKATTGDTLVLAQDQPQQQQRERRGPGMRGMRGGPGMEFRGLDLTADQRAQLRKIREARQAEFKAVGDKLGAARQGLRTLTQADSIDESAIRAKSQEVAAAEADFAILNAKVRAESLQILTSEQQTKLKELRSKRQERTRQRRGPRGQE
jgi:periplasmic protein CpxP/Spy